MPKRFTLQITNELNTWLTEQAALNHRSKNKQIEHLLELARRTPIHNRVEAVALSDVDLMEIDKQAREKWARELR